MKPDDHSLLRSVLPFRFLSPAGMDRLIAAGQVGTYPAGHIFMRQGDSADQQVYIIHRGMVEVIDQSQGVSHRISTIETGHYFGEWEAIFQVPRHYGIRAIQDCRCLSFPGETLLDLLDREQAFAQAFSAILRDRQGLFRGFELFRAEVLRGVGLGHIHLNKILPLYQALEPALHGGATDESRLDFAALDYAVRRLPANVGHTFAFLIRDELPSVFEEPATLFNPVPTDARRRAIWEVLPGKDLITVRSGMSDIMDFLTCLCVYSVEARKIRRRLYEGNVIRALRAWLDRGENFDNAAEAQFIHSLGFNTEEVSGLLRVWGRRVIRQLWDIINHREMFSVDVRRQLTQYNLKNFTRWSGQIGEACRALLGCDPRELGSDVDVHIISSNTHSVTNCLNPWFVEQRREIEAWAAKTSHPLSTVDWADPVDRVYAITRDYFRAHPDAEAAMIAAEHRAGILRLQATASTGIEAQVIHLGHGSKHPIDPSLPASSQRQGLIVNIDYAFGEQAEDIIHQLLLLFGRNVRSVNFLGKAGALVGKRSDILVPTAFIEQNADSYLEVPPSCPACADGIRGRSAELAVHVGPMLTVQGTLLQNRAMLQFYRQLWKVTGIEMEGYFYHRQVEEAKQTDLIRRDTVSRFFYYVSDLPLDTGSNLSERLSPGEGIPPLYAITREVLAGVLSTT